mgnify:CR=1 FL=1
MCDISAWCSLTPRKSWEEAMELTNTLAITLRIKPVAMGYRRQTIEKYVHGLEMNGDEEGANYHSETVVEFYPICLYLCDEHKEIIEWKDQLASQPQESPSVQA